MSDVLAITPTTDFAATPDANLERHAAGATLFSPGPDEHLFRLHEGLVRLFVLDDEGDGFTLRYVKPGMWFGEEPLAQLPRGAFAEAVTDVVIERAPLDAIGEADRARISEQLAAALHGLTLGMQRMAQRTLVARVAAELLDLRDSVLAVEEDGRPHVRITHDALAVSVGSVRETVTKVIGELSRAGAVTSGYRRIALVDEARLAAIADGVEHRPAA